MKENKKTTKVNQSIIGESDIVISQELEKYFSDSESCFSIEEEDPDLEKATVLIELAENEKKQKKAAKLLWEAIEICDYACDAYNMLHQFCDDFEEAIELLETSLKKYEKHVGPEFFKENEGDFWLLFGTRPYMRSLVNLYSMLHEIGQYSEAIEKMEYSLKLSPIDKVGARYKLFDTYVFLERFDEARELLKAYDEETAFFLYTKVIMEYKQGSYKKALATLKKAYQTNKYISLFLIGKTSLIEEDVYFFERGSKEEASVYVQNTPILLLSVPGLRLFIDKHLQEIRSGRE